MSATSSSPKDAPVLAITGASSGIGAATARAARAAGWRIALGARSLDRLEALATDLGGEDWALPAHLDVREWESQQQFVAATLDAFGQINAVFANAGFGAERGFERSTPEHWRDMVLTNVYGCALTIRAALPHVRAAKGHVLLTSSVAGRRVLPGSLYSATKFAVSAIGEALRQEVAEDDVRVTLIAPGLTDTPFFDDGTPSWALTAEDVAGAVMYALAQPRHVNVNEVLLRPTAQTV